MDDPETAAEQLNQDVVNIKSWADQWLVNFINPSKTKTMTVTNKNIEHPPLYFDGTELKSVTQHKHLGLMINSNLLWLVHC